MHSCAKYHISWTVSCLATGDKIPYMACWRIMDPINGAAMLARFIMFSGDIFMNGITGAGGGAALLADGNESDMGGPPWGA